MDVLGYETSLRWTLLCLRQIIIFLFPRLLLLFCSHWRQHLPSCFARVCRWNQVNCLRTLSGK